jgi:excinuclease ABC subunit C
VPTFVDSPLQALRATVRSGAQNRPGVYRMLARSGVVIYVGKSKRVRTRLLGYFRARETEKSWRIVREARKIEWDYAPSEFAALLLELELIKRYRPPYNVRQKRDTLYSFLKIGAGAAPKLQVVRRIGDDRGTYYGPFRGGQRIADAVRELNDVLQLRDCRTGMPIRFADQRELFETELVPGCPRYELNRCTGPCAGLCSEAEYAAQVDRATRFLTGDFDDPLRELMDRMGCAVERWEFEHAALLRDRLARLEMLRSEFQRLREALEGLTFLYAVPGFDSEHRIYAVRAGSIRGMYPAPRTRKQRERLVNDAEKHFERPEAPREITPRSRIEEILLVAHWFRTRPAEFDRAYPPDRWADLPLSRELERACVA